MVFVVVYFVIVFMLVCILLFYLSFVLFLFFFFFQAEDGIRDAQESRGLGDVYKRQDRYTGQASSMRPE